MHKFQNRNEGKKWRGVMGFKYILSNIYFFLSCLKYISSKT